MKTFQEQYGIKSGAVISAVDLIKGIGVYAGLTSIDVEGATGLYNTNYEGKAEAAIEALRNSDFLFLHVEASDEAGHEGDYELKKRTIEKAKENFSEQLAEKEKEIRQEISGEISSERILAEDEEIIAEMDRLFDEKSEEWAEEIFLKATQM
jgi:2,3-bisphosphoglycerate-independent phosphoglycerate mutase